MKTLTLPVKGLNFAGCAREIEKSLNKHDGIEHVDASYVSQTVTVVYDETKLSEAQLQAWVNDCGFLCGEPLTESGQVDQRKDMQHAGSPMMAERRAPPAMHQRAHAGMGGMEHDMSEPAMAKAMEADMRMRFFVSLVLTIPIVLYSPLGINVFKVHLPTPFGISPNWVLLVLATPVVWWGGWIFHSGTWRALRNRALNMNVLVSLGVLVAYFFSVFVPFFAPQV